VDQRPVCGLGRTEHSLDLTRDRKALPHLSILYPSHNPDCITPAYKFHNLGHSVSNYVFRHDFLCVNYFFVFFIGHVCCQIRSDADTRRNFASRQRQSHILAHVSKDSYFIQQNLEGRLQQIL
jgi:hypothetical protein